MTDHLEALFPLAALLILFRELKNESCHARTVP